MALPSLKILIIDDDEDDYFITSQYLGEIEEFQITCNWCYNIQEAIERLVSNSYDIYFLDYRLGPRTGLELLKEVVSSGCYKPIILLTGKGTTEIDKQAVQSGAYDYLIKSELSAEKLERCLRYATERYKSFSIIKEDEKKYRHIFQNAQSFIFICDMALNIVDCNSASEYLTGYTPEELKNTSFLSLIEKDVKTTLEVNTLTAKNTLHLRVRIKTKGGELKTGKLSLNYFDLGNNTAQWQGIIYDETMHLQMEKAKAQNDKLEATHRLIRTLAHEIRNPLTNINLSLEGMLEVGLDESLITYADIIKRNSHRINDLISELLNSSKSVNIVPELINLNVLLQEVMDIAQDRIQLKKIDTKVSLLDFPVIKKIDNEKFKIALLNLIVNATEAMDKEEKKLEVSLRQYVDQTVITIRDNGCGISEENIKKLFEPYFTTKKSGMGLGLVATFNIIKSHNATIEVDSELDIGTTFRIIFF